MPIPTLYSDSVQVHCQHPVIDFANTNRTSNANARPYQRQRQSGMQRYQNQKQSCSVTAPTESALKYQPPLISCERQTDQQALSNGWHSDSRLLSPAFVANFVEIDCLCPMETPRTDRRIRNTHRLIFSRASSVLRPGLNP